MSYEYWQKQSIDSPLFENLIWSKPQQKSRAGKLLIIGGNLHSISLPGEAYEIAQKQLVGDCKVVMPDATKKLLGSKPPLSIEFSSSTPSGSFSSKAYDDLVSFISWSNATLFAGDFSHSSETAILFEKLVSVPGMQIYTLDSVDNFIINPMSILNREDTLLVLNMAELQKYALNAGFQKAFISNMEILQLVEHLNEFTKTYSCHIVVEHNSQILVASGGQVISTKLTKEPNEWQIKIATTAAVWWLQNPTKPLQAIATAITQSGL